MWSPTGGKTRGSRARSDCEAGTAQTGGFLMGSRSDTRNAQSKGVDMEQNRATEYMASAYV